MSHRSCRCCPAQRCADFCVCAYKETRGTTRCGFGGRCELELLLIAAHGDFGQRCFGARDALHNNAFSGQRQPFGMRGLSCHYRRFASDRRRTLFTATTYEAAPSRTIHDIPAMWEAPGFWGGGNKLEHRNWSCHSTSSSVLPGYRYRCAELCRYTQGHARSCRRAYRRILRLIKRWDHVAAGT